MKFNRIKFETSEKFKLEVKKVKNQQRVKDEKRHRLDEEKFQSNEVTKSGKEGRHR